MSTWAKGFFIYNFKVTGVFMYLKMEGIHMLFPPAGTTDVITVIINVAEKHGLLVEEKVLPQISGIV